MDYKVDMSSMLAIHQALRRDMERLGRIAARPDDNPARLLRVAAGWVNQPRTKCEPRGPG